jgi:ribonuclease E
VLESTTTVCPVCQGSGHIRAPASVALHVLRSLEDQFLRGVTHHLAVRTRTPVALYILNQKRAHLSELEQRFGLSVTVLADEAIANGAHFTVERGEPIEHREPVPTTVQPDSVQPHHEALDAEAPPAPEVEPEDVLAEAEEQEGREEPEGREEDRPREAREDGGRSKRRRRRRNRGEEAVGQAPQTLSPGVEDEEMEGEELADEDGEGAGEASAAGDADSHGRKRRRGRRGGRRGRRGRGEGANGGDERPPEVAVAADLYPSGNGRQPSEALPAPLADPERQPAEEGREPAEMAAVAEQPRPLQPEEYRPAPRETEPAMTRADELAGPAEEPTPQPPPEPPTVEEEEEDPNRQKRGGWWQRRSFF